MQTRSFPSSPDGRSPAGAEVRFLIEGETGGMIHSTVPPGQVNRATVHATVSEFWHVLAGEGKIWRRDATGEETTVLSRGVSIDIPVGTAFQYRCTGVDPLQFPLHHNAALARRQGSDRHRGAVGTECSQGLTLPP